MVRYFAEKAISELSHSILNIDPGAVDAACKAIASANNIVLYGCGREALQIRGFAMRLHHLGCSVSMQGDISAPPLGEGDLFIASAGPGELSTVSALMTVAHEAGADILFLTAQPETASARLASLVLPISAQTMADDLDKTDASVLPMGSLYEGAMFILFEVMVLMLKKRIGVDAETMRARHTNME
ncbi:SIS domain-containing protein [Cohaesibacter celericrescens]|uniref:SIS domain-containing protein n=1 Tax=Cohaesibacter celericrescens TaxID=2067669 RepID=UPI0035667946